MIASELSALVSVILIDLVLAGDNAVVVGLAASGLPKDQRTRAIVIGIAAATVMRIAFATVTVQLLEIIGLLLAGGILLLWVAWKMWRELEVDRRRDQEEKEEGAAPAGETGATSARPRKTFGQAIVQIVLADISMSLDNVLAVAGAAREHVWVLVVGLALSVTFMGLAAAAIANLLQRYRWISYLGLAIIAFVALRMIWEGAAELVEQAPI